jgi:predicted amidophosphoribosyltransferase
MKIEQIATDKLIPYARNAKKHDAAQVSKLAGSIREFGFNNPVLIDKDNGIIAGHGRVMAAQSLALETVPCIRLGHLSDTQRRAYILADNRLAEIGGGWDEEMLKLELADLAALDVDVTEIGFGAEDIANLDMADEPETESSRELNLGPAMPFGLRYSPGIARRKGHATFTLSFYSGEKETIEKIKKWKTDGNENCDTTLAAAHAVCAFVKESGMSFFTVTTPERHHQGFHAATALAKKTSEILGIPFVDIFGFNQSRTGHHPARNTERDIKTENLECEEILGPVLIVDDVATSGETMRLSCAAIKAFNKPVLGVVLVHYWK